MFKVVLLSCFLLPLSALSHGGRTDKHGCHVKKDTGEYHCHKGPYDGKSFKNKKEGLEYIRNNGNKKK